MLTLFSKTSTILNCLTAVSSLPGMGSRPWFSKSTARHGATNLASVSECKMSNTWQLSSHSADMFITLIKNAGSDVRNRMNPVMTMPCSEGESSDADLGSINWSNAFKQAHRTAGHSRSSIEICITFDKNSGHIYTKQHPHALCVQVLPSTNKGAHRKRWGRKDEQRCLWLVL